MNHDDDFAAYVAARWANLVRAAVLLGCSIPEAEDVTQTALTRCYLAWDKVAQADDSDAYVYRVLVNCWSKSRKRKWWGEQPSQDLPEAGEPDATETITLRNLLVTALAALPVEQRTVVVLRFVADLTVPQVAASLNVPEGTVKSRLSRALNALAAAAPAKEEL